MSEKMSTADIVGRDGDDEFLPADEERLDTHVNEASSARLPQDAESLPSAEERHVEDTTKDHRGALLGAVDADRFRASWGNVQTHFVDAPRESVQEADMLVAELMQHLAVTFARERESLEEQWTRGEDVSTEDLRVALTRYRSFFDRLLEA
jgi:hypothetical protein